MKDDGYEVDHGGKLITVFSAPNYCDQVAGVRDQGQGDGRILPVQAIKSTSNQSAKCEPSCHPQLWGEEGKGDCMILAACCLHIEEEGSGRGEWEGGEGQGGGGGEGERGWCNIFCY